MRNEHDLRQHTCSVKTQQHKKRKTLTMKMVSLRKMTLEEVYTPRTSAFFVIGTVLCRCQRKASGLNVCLNQRKTCANPEGRKPTCTGGSAHNEFEARRTNTET